MSIPHAVLNEMGPCNVFLCIHTVPVDSCSIEYPPGRAYYKLSITGADRLHSDRLIRGASPVLMAGIARSLIAPERAVKLNYRCTSNVFWVMTFECFILHQSSEQSSVAANALPSKILTSSSTYCKINFEWQEHWNLTVANIYHNASLRRCLSACWQAALST